MCRTDDPEGPAETNGKMTQIIAEILIAKNILKQYGSGDGWDFGN